MKTIGIVGVVTGIMVVGILLFALQLRRAWAMIERWAAQNGYCIVERKRKWFPFGGLISWTHQSLTAYLVTVQDSENRTRRARISCGGWFLGLFLNRMTVTWEDEDGIPR